MKNLLCKKVDIYKSFANGMFSKFRRERFGLGKVLSDDMLNMYIIRKEIVDWQANDDAGALSEENIQYQTWLPTGMYDGETIYDPLKDGPGYRYSNPQSPDNLGVFYEYNNGSQNIIQVNANGAVTRINLNPSITINQNTSFMFNQPTPSMQWHIVHNMGMTPNVFAEDTNGNDIQGVVTIIDSNTLNINFNTPVAGKAYLS
jgi:hypothetical protein